MSTNRKLPEHPDGMSESQRKLIQSLFQAAILATNSKNYSDAEFKYRRILNLEHVPQPDLAAMSNLIEVLNLQHKYTEAEPLARRLLPILREETGENSPQSLGWMRKLMESLIGQEKLEEARELQEQAMYKVATITDDELREDEATALEAIGNKIASLG